MIGDEYGMTIAPSDDVASCDAILLDSYSSAKETLEEEEGHTLSEPRLVWTPSGNRAWLATGVPL